jgi:hypothetical protein
VQGHQDLCAFFSYRSSLTFRSVWVNFLKNFFGWYWSLNSGQGFPFGNQARYHLSHGSIWVNFCIYCAISLSTVLYMWGIYCLK